MLAYNEVTPKKYIVLDGEPYLVQSSHVFRKQQRKPVNQTKLKNIKTGKVVEHSFHQAETIEEADLSKKTIQYLYRNRGEFWFCEANNPKERFNLGSQLLGTGGDFLKANILVEALIFNDEIIGIDIPIKVDLIVKESAPAVRGNTAQGATKQVTLETGVPVNVPLFINEGDTIRINTETGQYTERVEKR